jgi:hypothetical protein
VRHRALDGRAQRPQVVGQVFAVSVVLQAIMPQPMSTPTAAGMMARRVGMTEPTVAPMPKCTSGMAAMCLKTMGRRAALVSWRLASSSTGTPRVHILMGTPPGHVFFDVVGFFHVFSFWPAIAGRSGHVQQCALDA